MEPRKFKVEIETNSTHTVIVEARSDEDAYDYVDNLNEQEILNLIDDRGELQDRSLAGIGYIEEIV